MNGNNAHSTAVPKNLPLKKRRAYLIDSADHGQDENFLTPRSATTNKQTLSQVDPLQIHLPTVVNPTPPSSPHLELLRQHYAYLMANSPNNPNLFVPPPPISYDCLMAQKVLAQQFLDNYRTFMDQQYANQQCGYTVIEDKQRGTDVTIDEHFRKSLGENYHKCTGGFLTPEDSSSNSSPIERTPVDSIEEHFARSLGKLWPPPAGAATDSSSTSGHQSDVDDHFAKALGATTWEKLREKS